MFPRTRSLAIFLMFIAFFATGSAPAQVEPSATGNGGAASDESGMMTPPPVSGMSYANTSSSDARSNYLNANVTISPAYINNVLPGAGSSPVGDFTYSILPSISFDRSAPRRMEQFSYSPSFNFYQKTTSLDSIDQNASAAFEYRFNPEVALSLGDNFSRISNVFDSSYVFSDSVTGSTLTPTPTVIAPFAQQMINIVNGVLSYQFGLNAMIGGGGSYTKFDFPNPADAAGLYNSNESGAEVFYNRRLSRAQYVGLDYNYGRILANPSNGAVETQVHTLRPFYTLYINRACSLSVSAGVDRTDATAPQAPESISWSPSVVASAGWQGSRGNIAGSYAHTVTSGGGLLGVYKSNEMSVSGGWRLARTWTGDISANYTSINSVTPLTVSSLTGGHTITVGGSVQHPIGERFSTSLQYQYLHENYGSIASIAADPDSNRVSFTFTYQFRKALGR
jgi:hypothetical protein